MFPLIFISSLIMLFLWRPQSSTILESEVYPVVGDVVTVMMPVRNSYLLQQREVTEIFANKGYLLIPVGSTYKNGSYFQKMQITGMNASIAVSRELGNGYFIHSIQKSF